MASAVFTTALQEFANVVGKEWVFSSDEDLELYRDAYSPLRDTADERRASAAVAPASTEQVQAIVRIANKYSVPLYPISTGKNLGYGGAAPVHSGGVVLDLKRLDRIIEVNEKNHYAIVEPGVTYFDLYNHIRERGLKVWLDCPDPGWGSVVGNALDHGVGYTGSRFRNHFDAHCGMEVVLANGEVMRTGMGALPGSKTWAEFKMGYGPIIDGIFSQSNFGVVTKMGFWLMPQPEAYLQAWVLAPRYEDLHAIIDVMNLAENSGLATGLPQLSSPLLGIGDSREMVDAFYEGPPALPRAQQELIQNAKLGFSSALAEYGVQHRLPYWGLRLSFYGPPKVVTAQWEAVQEIAARAIQGVTFKTDPVRTVPVDTERHPSVYVQQLGVPNLEFFAFGTRAGGNPNPMRGHMWFSPVIQRSGEALLEANRVFEEQTRPLRELGVPIWGLKPFAVPACVFERSFLFLLGFPVTEDPAKNKLFIDAFRSLIRIGAQNGWSEYRTPAIFQDQVMDVYSFNHNILRRFHETVKDAVDPKGILSPGRYGIWPKNLRKRRS